MRIRISIVFLVLVAAFAGCKQDFDILSKYEEIPVVYGLLNAQDSTHYIRVQKGYQVKGNAYLAAGILDSIYYPDNLTVQLVSGSDVIDLHRVTINFNPADPLSKDSGSFANNPNILYTVTRSLDINKEYTLQVIDTANNKTIMAKAKLVQDFPIFSPVYGQKITLSNSQPNAVSWAAAPNGSMYDLTVRFHYLEYSQANNVLLKDSFVDIALLRSFVPGSADDLANLKSTYIADNIFKTLAANLSKRDDVYRVFNIKKGMQYKFAVGGSSLERYISSRQAQGGLTSGEALPPFTNISGGGLGIFSSRYFKQVDSVLLNNGGIDSLACNDIMRPFRFKNHDNQFCN